MSPRVHCTYHCGKCHSHFTSLEAFDAHRAGPYSGERHCLDCDEHPDLVVKSEAGDCRMYAAPIVGRAVIWTTARAIGRAGAAFSHSSDVGVGSETPEDVIDRELAGVGA
jgi:hypothetical protein